MRSKVDNAIVDKPSNHSVEETLRRLEELLKTKGVKLFALVDHSGEAKKVGLTMPPTKLAIFGSPKAGTHLGVYLARMDGAIASAGWVRFLDGASFASLWGGTTLPAHRNRGLYSALVAVRAREAFRYGARYLTVDAAPTSRPILEKLGFRVLTYARGYKWKLRG